MSTVTEQASLKLRDLGWFDFADALDRGKAESAWHFLAITEEPYDVSMVHGIYETFEAARDDIDERTREGGHGIASAQIQEWIGRASCRTWAREGVARKWTQR